MIKLKRCSGYGPAGIKPHDTDIRYFYKNKASKDGLKSYCISCSLTQMRILNPIRNPQRDLSRYAESYARLRFRYKNNQPKWLTKEHKAEMKVVYDTRTMLNKEVGYTKYHVDHIYPIQGEKCSGLHVPWNLRIITAKENLEKKNQMPKERKLNEDIM